MNKTEKIIRSGLRKWLKKAKSGYFIERNKMDHHGGIFYSFDEYEAGKVFSMELMNSRLGHEKCSHCIGGWIIINLPESLYLEEKNEISMEIESMFGEFRHLFYPGDEDIPSELEYKDIPIKNAILAVESFLKTGKANWGYL